MEELFWLFFDFCFWIFFFLLFELSVNWICECGFYGVLFVGLKFWIDWSCEFCIFIVGVYYFWGGEILGYYWWRLGFGSFGFVVFLWWLFVEFFWGVWVVIFLWSVVVSFWVFLRCVKWSFMCNFWLCGVNFGVYRVIVCW